MDDYTTQISNWFRSEPACADDDESQIEWLRNNATPALLHWSVCEWNWDWGTKVLEWILSNPNSSFSSASLQLIWFAGSGSLQYEGPDVRFMADVASRLRAGFYKNNWSLPSGQSITARDRNLYSRGIAEAKNPLLWAIPEDSFGPFPDDLPGRGEFQFDGDGRIRLTFEAWRATLG